MSVDDDAPSILLRRARRLAKDGDVRKAALALRERAAILDDAASWVMAGAMWRRARRHADALAALRHGMWLHQRAGATRRARSVARIIAQVDGSAHGVAS
jgi:hypothetical protein